MLPQHMYPDYTLFKEVTSRTFRFINVQKQNSKKM